MNCKSGLESVQISNSITGILINFEDHTFFLFLNKLDKRDHGHDFRKKG